MGTFWPAGVVISSTLTSERGYSQLAIMVAALGSRREHMPETGLSPATAVPHSIAA